MQLSSRVKETKASVTLKVNEKINKMSASGQHVYNMTSGQLSIKPAPEFISSLSKQLNFIKSYQYSPISGMGALRRKFLKYIEEKRDLSFEEAEGDYDCAISNGSKHSLYNIFGAILNPGDEVVLFAPYWVSYPEIVKFWGGVPVYVKAHNFDAYTPAIEELKKVIGPKTKAIIVNSPNNPAGIHYTDEWMKDFAAFLKDYPDLMVVSDEIYSDLCYFDPKPKYFYQFNQKLLKQTIIVNGISKSLAATGLRIGYCIGPSKLTKAIGKIQSQTTSGPNSLIQRALIEFDFELLDNYFDPVKSQLRESAQFIRKSFRDVNLPHCYYQTNSSFYYLLDFSRMPFFKNWESVGNGANHDYSREIVEDILEKTGVALVPGTSFGYPNSARMSLTLEIEPFKEAITKLMEYISQK